MGYWELREYVGRLKKSGFDIVRLNVDLQRKLSFPLITVVMTLIAIPFAVATGRRGALYGIGAGIALAMSYWITGNVFGAIGAAGLLAPLLAAWAPNLLFGIAAVYLLLTVRT
jgi:lipopolysaccharide export LptBFGC system permease protein LptF